MDKHVFLCETESEYEALVYETPHVALTEDDDIVHYDEEQPTYKFLDILWNDGKITPEIREPEGDLAPVAICVIPTGYLGKGEKARFMSLSYVGRTNGANEPINISWGPDSPSDNDPLADMYTDLICKNINDPSVDLTSGSFVWSLPNNTWPDLRYNEEGTAWKNAQQYLYDPEKKYLMGDIDGKGNTKRIMEALDFANNSNYAFVNLKKFNPYSLDIEWYIPAAGELLNMLFNTGHDNYVLDGDKFSEGSLCDIMKKINAKYPSKSVSKVYNGYNHWSSSPMSAIRAADFYCNDNICGEGFYYRYTSSSVLAFTQL